MKKIIILVLVMFLGIGFVNALEEISVNLISVSEDSATLKVMVNDSDKNDICYLYRALDNVNYENQMIVNCNMMYVDKSLEPGMTYYYRARYGNSDLYSEEIVVNTKDIKEDSLKISRDINEITRNGILFGCMFGIFMIISLVYMVSFKKKRFN